MKKVIQMVSFDKYNNIIDIYEIEESFFKKDTQLVNSAREFLYKNIKAGRKIIIESFGKDEEKGENNENNDM